MPRMRAVALMAATLGAVLVPTLARGELLRYSGVVDSVDRSSGSLTIGEVGPWRLERGQTVITRRTVHWDAQTRFVRLRRVADPPSGYRGDFVEEHADASAATPGAFVTVECERYGTRLRAIRLAIADPTEP